MDPTTLDQNQANDVMHIVCHAGSGAEVFVTYNLWDFINDAKRERWRILASRS